MDSSRHSPWKLIETSETTGRQLWERPEGFERTGNHEGTITCGIRVTDVEGVELLRTSVTVEWEYHGSVSAHFILDATAILVKGSNDFEQVLELDA